MVKVKAASLNMIDCKLRYGFGKSILDNRCEVTSEGHMKGPPFIVGRDFSGEIVSVGPSVPDLPEFELGSAVSFILYCFSFGYFCNFRWDF